MPGPYMTGFTYDGYTYLTFLQTTPTIKFIRLNAVLQSFAFGLRVQPHMCVPIRAPSLTSCLQEIGYMELEHKLLPLHTRALKLFWEFSNFCSSSNRPHASSRRLDSRFPRFPFRALELSFTPSIFPLFNLFASKCFLMANRWQRARVFSCFTRDWVELHFYSYFCFFLSIVCI